MRFYLGIDGGGSGTTAWCADERRKVLGRAEAGPSNPLKTGFDKAQRQILLAARSAMREAHARELEAICLGLAGGGEARIRSRMERWLRREITSRVYAVTTDAAIAHAAAFGHGPGIILIAGTGSIAYAKDESGRLMRAGGWGSDFDDAGSGYDIGRKAIIAALRAEDGRGEATTLGRMMARKLGLAQLSEATLHPPPIEQVAALFPVVSRAANRGDAVASAIVKSAGEELAQLVIALTQRLGWRRKTFVVACVGGVLRHNPRIKGIVESRVRAFAPNAQVVVLHRPPVEGALILARSG